MACKLQKTMLGDIRHVPVAARRKISVVSMRDCDPSHKIATRVLDRLALTQKRSPVSPRELGYVG
jgi:hypothetical protein